jgi:hypothetical protein
MSVVRTSEEQTLVGELRKYAEAWGGRAGNQSAIAITCRQAAEQIDDFRSVLLEVRIGLHAQGRRPEECHEMAMIDSALAAQRARDKDC